MPLANLLAQLVHSRHDFVVGLLVTRRFVVVLVVFLELQLAVDRPTEGTGHTGSSTPVHCLGHSDHLEYLRWNAVFFVVVFVVVVFVEWDSLSHHDSAHWTVHFNDFFFA